MNSNLTLVLSSLCKLEFISGRFRSYEIQSILVKFFYDWNDTASEIIGICITRSAIWR
jgi:hypothetical protein